jgi:tetratricopeptide (TPR) repeat protein
MERIPMRRVNVKLLLILLGLSVLLTTAVVLAHELQTENISSALLWQAEQAQKQGRLTEAARFLRRYLEFVPDDVEERVHLGRLLADPTLTITNRGRQRARFVIDQVLAREPDRHELRQLLVQLALDSGQTDLAREHLQYLSGTRAADPEVQGLTAQLQEQDGHQDLAIKTYRKALKAGPDRVALHVKLCHLLLDRERKQPGSQSREIQGLVTAALKNSSNDPAVLLVACQWAALQGDRDAGRRYLEKGLMACPKDVRLHQALAALESEAGKRDEAVRVARRGLEAVAPADRPELLWTLANLLLDGDKVADAREIASKLRDLLGPAATVDFLEARCLLGQQRWQDAADTLERVRTALKAGPGVLSRVDLFLGRCYEQLSEPGRQLAAYSRALAQDPTLVEARQGLAAAQWALGRPDEAIAQTRQLLEKRSTVEGKAAGHLDLARMLLASNAQKDQRRWKLVEDELDRAEKEQSGAVPTALLRAQLRLAQDQPAQAEQVLRAALEQHPKDIAPWSALTALAQRRGDDATAQKTLDEAERQAGDSVDLRLARAGYWAGRPQHDAAPALVRLEAGIERFAAPDRNRLLRGLAEANYRAGEVSQAIRLWKHLASQPAHAHDLRLRLLLLDVAIRQGDDPAMRLVLDEIKRLDDGDGTSWQYGQAARLLWLARQGKKDGLAQARTLLDKVMARWPQFVPALMARAELDELQGRPQEAIARYRQAVERGVRDAFVVRRLVQLLSAQQRYQEAEQVVLQMEQRAPLSAELRRLAVVLSLRNDDFRRAEELVRQAGPAQANDYADQLWLGQVLAAGRRHDAEAEKALRRAVQLAKSVPETWVALVRFLADSGKLDQARAEVEKACTQLPGATTSLALAQCYEMIREPGRAGEVYKAALQARPDEPVTVRAAVTFLLRSSHLPEAEQQLRRLLDGKHNLPREEVTWARWTLALVLVSSQDPRRLTEGLSLVGLKLDDQGKLVKDLAPGTAQGREDNIQRARVLATQNRRPFRARAIDLLERAAQEQPLAPEDQFLLARLYLAQGTGDVWWGKARGQFKELVANNGREPTYLVAYTQGLLDHGALAEAEQILNRLEEVEKSRPALPGGPGSVVLRAQFLEASGRGAKALTVLESYAAKPGAPAERRFLVAALQGRLGDLKKALDICEKAKGSCPPEAITGTALSILRAARENAKATDPSSWREQAGRLESWLAADVRAQAKTVAVRLQLADLLELLGRPEDAEKHYRQVLEHDGKNPVALNNLAWQLAHQPGKQIDALALVNYAIELYGRQAELLDTRGMVYLAQGQTHSAIADLSQAVTDAPSPGNSFHLAQAFQQARDRRSALQTLNDAAAVGLTAERLSPADRDTYRRMVAELKQN